jgi:hypothetical protein
MMRRAGKTRMRSKKFQTTVEPTKRPKCRMAGITEAQFA